MFDKKEIADNAANAEMIQKIRFVIAHYKANFPTVHEQEIYKWKAIRWYQQHWDIDAPDFAKMLATAFGKASNLLASRMYYSYKMITEYANANPEAVHSINLTDMRNSLRVSALLCRMRAMTEHQEISNTVSSPECSKSL